MIRGERNAGATRMDRKETEEGCSGGCRGEAKRGRNDGFQAPLKRSFSVYFS